MDLIDRACWHGYVWCREGCHDDTPWEADNEGVNLWLTLAEDLVNGELSAFDAEGDIDGLDEALGLAFVLLHEEGSDCGT